MGADDAIHVEIPDGSLGGPLEPLGVSKILSAVIKKESESEEVGLVIMGKQAIDDDASQTGQMLAAMLDWPQATFASKLEFLGKLEKGEKVRVTREVDGGLGIVETTLPFVMTTDLRLNGEISPPCREILADSSSSLPLLALMLIASFPSPLPVL
jgi:electron transfer flavoprotein beta subunit